MRLSTASLAIASLLSLASASHGHHGAPHASAARRHMHHHSRKSGGLTKRSQCKFPTDKGLVAVTPGAMNAGWAMSPDQPCEPGMYCPYACPPGMLMAQWDPKATKYAYPESMRGGLYCNDDGEIEIPFENKPLCYPGTGVYSVKNESGKSVAICQTVLPGNEAMLIPTVVQSSATLAVPDTSYWCKTAAHYYINPPGVSATDGCIWGTKDKPHGNWTPYVAGANTLDNGETFVKIGWNPIYIEPDVPFRTERPKYGIRIECEGTCGGLPCEIDPAKHDVNEVSQMKGSGAGGANFCVVSVSKGSKANLVIFNSNGGGGGGDKPKDEEEEKPKEEEEEEEKPEEEEEEEKPEEEEKEEKEEKEEEKEEEKGIKGVQVKTSTSATSTKTSSREASSTSSQAPTKSARPSRIPLFVEETTSAYEPEKTEEPENDNRHNVLAQAGGNPISDDSGSLTADGSKSDKPSAGLRIEASQLAALLVTGTMGVIALVL